VARGPRLALPPAAGQRDVEQFRAEGGEHLAMQLVIYPLPERNGARGTDHAIMEEGLHQRRADQVSLPGGSGPSAGPVG